MSIPRWLTLFLIVLLTVPAGTASAQQDTSAEALLQQLAEANARDTEAAIKAIATSGHERARDWLDAYGNNRLSQVEDTGQIVIVLNNRGRDWEVADAITGENLGEMSRRDLDRIAVNNAIRRQLEGVMAMMDLYANDLEVREALIIRRRAASILAVDLEDVLGVKLARDAKLLPDGVGKGVKGVGPGWVVVAVLLLLVTAPLLPTVLCEANDKVDV